MVKKLLIAVVITLFSINTATAQNEHFAENNKYSGNIVKISPVTDDAINHFDIADCNKYGLDYDCLLQKAELYRLAGAESCLKINRSLHEKFIKKKPPFYKPTEYDDGINQCLFIMILNISEDNFIYDSDGYVVGFIDDSEGRKILWKFTYNYQADEIGEIIDGEIKGCAHLDSNGKVILDNDCKIPSGRGCGAVPPWGQII